LISTSIFEFGFKNLSFLFFKPFLMLKSSFIFILLFFKVSSNFLESLLLQHLFYFSSHGTDLLILIHLISIELTIYW
jgi:hypothetical protein